MAIQKMVFNQGVLIKRKYENILKDHSTYFPQQFAIVTKINLSDVRE